MEWSTKTQELYEIIKAIPYSVLSRMTNLTSGVGTVLTYKMDNEQNIITFDYSWNHSVSPITVTASGYVTGASITQPLTVPGSVTGPSWTSGTHITPSPAAKPIKRVRVVTSTDRKNLLTLQWNDMAVIGNSQYVYVTNQQGHYVPDEGKIIISAMPLTDGRALVNGVLYNPEESPTAFLNDIDSDGISILEVIKLLGQY